MHKDVKSLLVNSSSEMGSLFYINFMTNNKITIYQHINKINGLKYSGQTSKSIEERAGKNGCLYQKSKYFGPAIKEFGWNNFDHVICKIVYTKEEANYWEAYYTKNTLWPNGYNVALVKSHKPHNEKKKCYTNGLVNKYASKCPEGFWEGSTQIRTKYSKQEWQKKAAELYSENNLGLTWNQFQKHIREKSN